MYSEYRPYEPNLVGLRGAITDRKGIPIISVEEKNGRLIISYGGQSFTAKEIEALANALMRAAEVARNTEKLP